MELWIRSQDKEDLVKVDNIRIKHEYYQKEVKDNYGRISAYIDGNYIKSIIYANSSWLGEYKSKERALEVLDEIQDLIKPKIITTNYECELKENLSKLSFDLEMIPQKTEIQELSTIVYEMPKE